ncbi:hypothetical protein CIL05_07520 [Virgibacillus profundi]|uniref:Uncharacterized protein n=1 Tax=Virgibacillus profundi TaxID=2024555 RepID=A0A2A2IGP0_9BACI|nr:hypothetical protein [Virgibacillus profundi]PAV30310.1 hypothetical protein CIL05_07520 [Virgibacillus profundi]PXY54482.1 hypothetical protein CIT14_07605 [Virgibacillus profundi]
MEFLYVYGDECAAMDFKEHFDVSSIVKQLRASTDKRITLEDSNENEYTFKLLEFGDVDPKFVNFVRNEMIDYDHAKQKDFFEIVEGG